jgi:hypothetical protein
MLTSWFGALEHNSKWNQHVRFFQPRRTQDPDEPKKNKKFLEMHNTLTQEKGFYYELIVNGNKTHGRMGSSDLDAYRAYINIRNDQLRLRNWQNDQATRQRIMKDVMIHEMIHNYIEYLQNTGKPNPNNLQHKPNIGNSIPTGFGSLEEYLRIHYPSNNKDINKERKLYKTKGLELDISPEAQQLIQEIINNK